MKKILIICALLMPAFSIYAQNNSKIEADIRLLEEREHKAMLNQDAATLQRIWAADFMVNAPFNRVTLSSKEVINLVKQGVIKYSSFTRDIEQVLIKKDMAITMGSEQVVPLGDAPNAGKTINRRYTNIWLRQNGDWRLVARHANEIGQ
jgi:hypothetical protein